MWRRHTIEEATEFGRGEVAQVLARDDRTGQLVFLERGAADAMRPVAIAHFSCPIPGCDAPRPLSTRGQSVRDHFFHRTPHSHPGGLESLNHFQAKHVLAGWATSAGLDVRVNEEEWSPDIRRRADVMVTWPEGKQVAIEVEYKSYRAVDWKQKNSDYLSRGITPLWIFGHAPSRYLRPDTRAAYARGPDAPPGYRLGQLTKAVIESGQPVLIINPVVRKVGTLYLAATSLEHAQTQPRWWSRPGVVGTPAAPQPDLQSSLELAVCDLDECTLDPERGMVTPTILAIATELDRVNAAARVDRAAWDAEEKRAYVRRAETQAQARCRPWTSTRPAAAPTGYKCRACGLALSEVLAASGYHVMCNPDFSQRRFGPPRPAAPIRSTPAPAARTGEALW
ncbi:MAG: competence protein CoiA family protein [Cellulomonas sp.]